MSIYDPDAKTGEFTKELWRLALTHSKFYYPDAFNLLVLPIGLPVPSPVDKSISVDYYNYFNASHYRFNKLIVPELTNLTEPNNVIKHESDKFLAFLVKRTYFHINYAIAISF